MFDGEKRLVMCNDQYAFLYALPPELRIPGTPFLDILEHRVRTGTSDASQQYVGRRMQSVAGNARYVEIIEQQDGRSIQVQFYPLTDGGWIALHEDVTARPNNEQAADQKPDATSNSVPGAPA